MLEILLVDDDELMRQSLAMLLGYEGFRVALAGDGKAAVELARQQLFDLIISDVRMPGLDGFAVVRLLRELQSEAHFILMTGFASEDAPVEALRLGVDDYFRKPFDLNFFLERIRLLRRQRLRRQRLRSSGVEQALEQFTAWMRRRPGYARKIDEVEESITRAAQRLGLDSPALQALRLAVQFQDLVADLPAFPEEAWEWGDSVGEQAARLLTLAGAQPSSPELAVQLLRASLYLRRPEPESRPSIDGRIWQELGAAHSPPAGAPSEQASLRIHTLGQTLICWGDQEIPAARWESQRARWLFLYLVTRRGQWVSAERLRALFWPESDSEKSQRSLVSTIHRCRKALGESALLERSERGYRVEPGPQLWWDLDQLERCHLQAQSGAPEAALRRLEELYRGGFCPDCPYSWAQPWRELAQRYALEGLLRLGKLLLDDPAAAEIRARKALALEATSEAAAELWLRALWLQGKRDEAVRGYREFCRRLERELQLPPGPELVRSYLELTQMGAS